MKIDLSFLLFLKSNMFQFMIFVVFLLIWFELSLPFMLNLVGIWESLDLFNFLEMGFCLFL
jgi:hypothetical protein